MKPSLSILMLALSCSAVPHAFADDCPPEVPDCSLPPAPSLPRPAPQPDPIYSGVAPFVVGSIWVDADKKQCTQQFDREEPAAGDTPRTLIFTLQDCADAGTVRQYQCDWEDEGDWDNDGEGIYTETCTDQSSGWAIQDENDARSFTLQMSDATGALVDVDYRLKDDALLAIFSNATSAFQQARKLSPSGLVDVGVALQGHCVTQYEPEKNETLKFTVVNDAVVGAGVSATLSADDEGYPDEDFPILLKDDGNGDLVYQSSTPDDVNTQYGVLQAAMREATDKNGAKYYMLQLTRNWGTYCDFKETP